MERNHLSPQQVLPWCDTGRDSNCVDAAVANDLGCAPVTSVVTVLLDLEPTGRYVSARLMKYWPDLISFWIALTIRCRHPYPSRRCRLSSDMPT